MMIPTGERRGRPTGAAQQMEAKFAWGRHLTFAACTELNAVEVIMGWVEISVYSIIAGILRF